MEYWCFENDAFWKQTDEEIIALAKKELQSIQDFKKAAILDAHVVKIGKCYPIYNVGYKKNSQAKYYLKSPHDVRVFLKKLCRGAYATSG